MRNLSLVLYSLILLLFLAGGIYLSQGQYAYAVFFLFMGLAFLILTRFLNVKNLQTKKVVYSRLLASSSSYYVHFEVISHRTSLDVLNSDGDVKCTQEIEIKALTNGVDRYCFSYVGSPLGRINEITCKPDANPIINNSSQCTEIIIKLPKPLNTDDDPIKIEISFKLTAAFIEPEEFYFYRKALRGNPRITFEINFLPERFPTEILLYKRSIAIDATDIETKAPIFVQSYSPRGADMKQKFRIQNHDPLEFGETLEFRWNW